MSPTTPVPREDKVGRYRAPVVRKAYRPSAPLLSMIFW